MENIEAIFILESLAIKRATKLNNIAIDMLMNGFPRKPASTKYLVELQHLAVLDDLEILQRFKGYMPKVIELHTTRCEDSGVTECICLAKTTGREDLVTF